MNEKKMQKSKLKTENDKSKLEQGSDQRFSDISFCILTLSF